MAAAIQGLPPLPKSLSGLLSFNKESMSREADLRRRSSGNSLLGSIVNRTGNQTGAQAGRGMQPQHQQQQQQPGASGSSSGYSSSSTIQSNSPTPSPLRPATQPHKVTPAYFYLEFRVII